MNMIVGKILVLLYDFINIISWYELFQYVIIFISLVQITKILTKKLESIYSFSNYSIN